MFSESNTRWIVEVKKDKAKDFEKIMKTSFVKIGEVKGKSLVVSDNKKIIDLKVDAIRDSWSNAIWDVMG